MVALLNFLHVLADIQDSHCAIGGHAHGVELKAVR